jgi:spore protease
MSEELNLNQYQVRTDLAVEAHQIVVEQEEKSGKPSKDVSGVQINEETIDDVRTWELECDT